MSAKRLFGWVLVCGLTLGVTQGSWAESKGAEKSAGKAAAKAGQAEADAQKGADKAMAKADKAAAGPKLNGYYAGMAKEAELSEADKAKLAELTKAKSEAMGKWDAEHGAELAAAKAKVAETKGDKEANKAAKAQYDELKKQRQALEEEHEAKIQGSLTPEQQVKWTRAGLYQGVLRKYKDANLTEEQKASIKDLSLASAKEIQALPNKNAKATGPIKDKLYEDVKAKVLTEEQRAALAAPKEHKDHDHKEHEAKAKKG